MAATLLAPAVAAAPAPSARTRRAGRALTGLVIALLAADTAFKFLPQPAEAAAATAQLGWAMDQMPVVGALGLACLVLYAVPRTALLGAVLWTGYLGGAVATHLRVGNPLLTHTLFPVYVGALVWGALVLRDPRLRALVRPAAR